MSRVGLSTIPDAASKATDYYLHYYSRKARPGGGKPPPKLTVPSEISYQNQNGTIYIPIKN